MNKSTIKENIKGIKITYVKNRFTQSFSKGDQLISPGKALKSLSGILKMASDSILLVPVTATDKGLEQKQQHWPAPARHNPQWITPTQLLYLQVKKYPIEGVFILRTNKTLYTLKKYPINMNYLR